MARDAVDDVKERAARKVLRAWRSFRDRRVFSYLRHAVCRAEDSLTHQVLRKVAPIEAYLLRDPTLNARLRFRFGGSSFPPVILYKIFVNANVQYVAGSTAIEPGSRAANDACDRMGERKYFDIVLSDIENNTPVADSRLVKEHSVNIQTRLREHGQADELPIWLGGRGNGWRMLIDERYSVNENALRFDATQDLASGKGGKIMAAMLDAVEKSVLSQHVHSTVPLNKQFASKETLDRIKTSQARARSRGMLALYSQGLRHDNDSGMDQSSPDKSGGAERVHRGVELAARDSASLEEERILAEARRGAMMMPGLSSSAEAGHLAQASSATVASSPDTSLSRTIVSSSGLRGSIGGDSSRGEVSPLRGSARADGPRWSSSRSPSRGNTNTSGHSPTRTPGLMRTGGTATSVGSTTRRGGMGGASMDDEEFDTVTDSLLNWAGGLSFEQYHDTWEKTAATILPESTL